MRVILSCGNNRKYAEIARRCKCGVGARLPVKNLPSGRLEFADCDWRRFDQAAWFDALVRMRPETATLPDMEDAVSIERALNLIGRVAPYVRALILVPKSLDALTVVESLPERIGTCEIWVGLSVPSRYGAASLPLWTAFSRPVHLLGGSPQQQVELARYLPKVVQVDGTAIISAARFGTYFDGKRWRRTPRRRFTIEQLLELSLTAWRQCFGVG